MPYRTKTVSIKYRGREVQNPVARKAIAALLVVVAIIVVVIVTALSPALLVMHFILRLLGRQGFTYVDDAYDIFKIDVNFIKCFRKRSYL